VNQPVDGASKCDGDRYRKAPSEKHRRESVRIGEMSIDEIERKGLPHLSSCVHGGKIEKPPVEKLEGSRHIIKRCVMYLDAVPQLAAGDGSNLSPGERRHRRQHLQTT